MSFVATPEQAATLRCPTCGGPSACALGWRHVLLCRCVPCGNKFWTVDARTAFGPATPGNGKDGEP